jgi:fructose-1,6-bisphosphatase
MESFGFVILIIAWVNIYTTIFKETMKIKFFIPIILLCLAACQNALSPGDSEPNQILSMEEQAQLNLIKFFDLLNSGKYEEVVPLYGGSYEVLQSYNPTVDPNNKVDLLQSACEINGFMCLKVDQVERLKKPSTNEFIYQVTFINPAGNLFELGPCCGATEEEMPPVSQFEIRVTCSENHSCQVLDLPPYVP